MSEIRRVPLDWKHPTEPNPHWEFQQMLRMRAGDPPSRLHGPRERFVPLFEDYPGALAGWQADGEALGRHEGHDWKWAVEWHLTGHVCEDWREVGDPRRHAHDDPQTHPYYRDDAQDESEGITVRDEDHLYSLMMSDHVLGKPKPEQYMPVFDVPEEQMGWCLYETVSEGTPVTPVLPTAEALVEHLVTIGEDYDQKPYRREAAEMLVRRGGSVGSVVSVDGRIGTRPPE